jgi:hypothetical protein
MCRKTAWVLSGRRFLVVNGILINACYNGGNLSRVTVGAVTLRKIKFSLSDSGLTVTLRR